MNEWSDKYYPLIIPVRIEGIWDKQNNGFVSINRNIKHENHQFMRNILLISSANKGCFIYAYEPNNVIQYHTYFQFTQIQQCIQEANKNIPNQISCDSKYYIPSYLQLFDFKTRGKFYVSDAFLSLDIESRQEQNFLVFNVNNEHIRIQVLKKLVSQIYRHTHEDCVTTDQILQISSTLDQPITPKINSITSKVIKDLQYS